MKMKKGKGKIQSNNLVFIYKTEDCHGLRPRKDMENKFEKTKPIHRPSAGNLCLRYSKHETLNPKQNEFGGGN